VGHIPGEARGATAAESFFFAGVRCVSIFFLAFIRARRAVVILKQGNLVVVVGHTNAPLRESRRLKEVRSRAVGASVLSFGARTLNQPENIRGRACASTVAAICASHRMCFFTYFPSVNFLREAVAPSCDNSHLTGRGDPPARRRHSNGAQGFCLESPSSPWATAHDYSLASAKAVLGIGQM